MPSERVQRRIDRLLDQADEALERRDWSEAEQCARAALGLDPEHKEARAFLKAALDAIGGSGDSAVGSAAAEGVGDRPSSRSVAGDGGRSGAGGRSSAVDGAAATAGSSVSPDAAAASAPPTSFAAGRYVVDRFLGEGGKKRVFLAHDETLDRDVAFALIKTEGLDETSRERVRREAQAMGRLGNHPNVVPIYDLGEEPVAGATGTQPYMVQPLMAGGDVEGLIEEAEGPLDLETALRIATQTAQGLSFAHSKGIVHRDLKPGNVWLDEDGSAKIGDFGLAVTTDRSRLTTEKVMVGTVSYMPPEQATGVDVTPAADLYSLGAMLYEMCTGRVPFMGDDDIAVISQHINTPPVAPSWHNRLVPKALDALVMRLLAKDPSERPGSAEEVLAALQAVDLSAAADDAEEREEREAGLGSLDSMAGGVFVGRQREMDQLKSTFEDALGGRGRLVTLVGEPGIGKTRTAQELATYSSMRGAQVLWGRSYEGGGAPPYWPWVQAIRSHVTATEETLLRSQMGTTASVISEVVPEVKQTLPEVQPPPPIEDPESARFRLFDSITTFLKTTSENQPLVVMLEDLHWADRPSLSLLEFVARELSDSRLLIVGNYRDVELNRRHPLSMTLGELGRERLFDRVVLRGLARDEIERFIEVAAGTEAPEQLITTVYEHTEGNPLFMTETVRLLVQEGEIASGQASKRGATSWELKIPEGVREVIGRRLDKLSERCNELLSTAAVIGRQFRFDVLLKLDEELTENSLLDLMDEALGARVVEELSGEIGHYQFSHALIEETLTDELSLTRKVRLHARIARALEEYYGDTATAHAEQLAHHFAQAETILGSEQAILHHFYAGETAKRRFAVEEAERYLSYIEDRCPVVDSELIADAYAELAQVRAEFTYGDEEKTLAYRELGEKAFDYYAKNGLNEKAIELSIELPAHMHSHDSVLKLCEQAFKLENEDEPLALRLNARYARSLSLAGTDRVDEGSRLLKETLVRARDLGLNTTACQILHFLAQIAFLSNRYDESQQRADEALNLATTVAERINAGSAAFFASHAALAVGNREVSERLAETCFSIGHESRHPNTIWMGEFALLSLAILTADRERLDTLVDLPPAIFGSRGDLADTSREVEKMFKELLFRDSSEIEARVSQMEAERGGGPLGEDLDRRVLGRIRDSRAMFGHWTLNRRHIDRAVEACSKMTGWDIKPDAADGYTSIGRATLISAGLIAAIARLTEHAAKLIDELTPWQGTYDTGFWHGTYASVDLIIAMLHDVLGETASAGKMFEQAIQSVDAAEYPPLRILARSDYSAMLLRTDPVGSRALIEQLQGEALEIATAYKMPILTERVLAQKKLVSA